MAHAYCILYTYGYKTTLKMPYLLHFHCNNGCTNAPRCYIVRTLLSCLYSESQQYSDTKGSEHYLGMRAVVPLPLPNSRHAFLFYLLLINEENVSRHAFLFYMLLINEENVLYKQYSSKVPVPVAARSKA
jgi:hypothetical protein